MDGLFLVSFQDNQVAFVPVATEAAPVLRGHHSVLGWAVRHSRKGLVIAVRMGARSDRGVAAVHLDFFVAVVLVLSDH